jgi:putative ABC transport system substrate-binding protein
MAQEEQAGAAFAKLAKERAEAVLIAHHPLFQNHRKYILQLAEKHRIPAIGHRTYFAEEGALLSYGSVLDLQMRRSAHLVDKILKGGKPGDIPVEQPTRLEFVVNLTTAKRLGLTVPQEVLLRADRIVE